jgi:hypothetical protein
MMEPSAIVLITARILFPIAVSLGINPVHLDILMTVTMEVASAIRRTASISTSPPALPAWASPSAPLRPGPGSHHADPSRDGELHSGTVALAPARARDVVGRRPSGNLLIGHSGTRAEASGPGIQMQLRNLGLDSGFAVCDRAAE